MQVKYECRQCTEMKGKTVQWCCTTSTNTNWQKTGSFNFENETENKIFDYWCKLTGQFEGRLVKKGQNSNLPVTLVNEAMRRKVRLCGTGTLTTTGALSFTAFSQVLRLCRNWECSLLTAFGCLQSHWEQSVDGKQSRGTDTSAKDEREGQGADDSRGSDSRLI